MSKWSSDFAVGKLLKNKSGKNIVAYKVGIFLLAGKMQSNSVTLQGYSATQC